MRTLRKHPFSAAVLFLDLFFLILSLLFWLLPAFSEFFAAHIAAGVRLFLAKLTGVLPFSLFEILLFLAGLYLIFLLGFSVFLLIQKGRRQKPPAGAGAFYRAVLVALSAVFWLFCLTLSPSYFRRSTAEMMALDLDAVDDEAVFCAFETLVDTISETAPPLSKNENGESLCPGSFREMSRKIKTEADRFGRESAFYPADGAACKPLLVSPVMTYTHISGVYGFFTGEANVNTNFPSFIVCYTMAHETSHARGIAPENECNFLAFAVLFSSEDSYLRYCASLYVLENFASVCRRIDAERYAAVLERLDDTALRDLSAYHEFMKTYDGAAAGAANAVNTAY